MKRYRSLVLAAVAVAMVSAPLYATDAAALFKTKCSMCHGQDGSGNTTMGKKLALRSFAAAEVQSQTDAQLTAVIKNGKAKMPAYGGKIPDAGIAALVAHIRTFAKK